MYVWSVNGAWRYGNDLAHTHVQPTATVWKFTVKHFLFFGSCMSTNMFLYIGTAFSSVSWWVWGYEQWWDSHSASNITPGILRALVRGLKQQYEINITLTHITFTEQIFCLASSQVLCFDWLEWVDYFSITVALTVVQLYIIIIYNIINNI